MEEKLEVMVSVFDGLRIIKKKDGKNENIKVKQIAKHYK